MGPRWDPEDRVRRKSRRAQSTTARGLTNPNIRSPRVVIYERITVAGPEIVGVRLAAAAYAHGLALALPQVVMARPEGFEPPTRLLQT